MGKHHHHQKKVKSERAKTKLRVKTEKTKFLPKGLNVTKTDFKVKAIVLPQQLREHAQGELLSKRKLNLKDILSRLKHHNVNVKHDCCDELKQLLDVHTDELLGQHFSQVLHGVAPLLLDREKKVRRDAINIFNCIFEKVSVDNMEPFFSVLSSYLRCSMTNIDRAIQEDSLLLLDALLKHAPGLVAADGEKILPNLFSLISKLKNDSQPGRTLTMNLDSKVTSVKWRVQVLMRLHGFLKAIVENKKRHIFDRNHEGIVLFARDTNLIPLIHNPYVDTVDTVHFSTVLREVPETDVIARNFGTLTSLLNEVWMEVAPMQDGKNGNKEGTLLNAEAGAVLTWILHLLNLLLQYRSKDEQANTKDFFTPNCLSFLYNVTNLFPFSQTVEKKKKGASGVQKLLDANSDPKCTKENLLIAQLFCLSHKTIQNKVNQERARRILNYVNNCITIKNQADTSFILPVADTLLLQNYSSWEKEGLPMGEFLNNVVRFFGRNAGATRAKKQAFDLLSKILQIPQLNRCESYQEWLGSLQGLLCNQEISAAVLEVLLLIAKQNNQTFLSSLMGKMSEILENYDRIKVTNCDHPEIMKPKIIHLFFYCPQLSPQQRALLDNYNKKREQPLPVIEYILAQ